MAAWVLSAFRDRSLTVMMTLYRSMVRLKLEYCCPVWNPTKVIEIQKVKNVQRAFRRKILGCKVLSYWERLTKLKLMSLQWRRERSCIIHIWKILHGQAPNDLGFEFKQNVKLGVKVELPRLKESAQMSFRRNYGLSFRVRAAQLFNLLPPDVGRLPPLEGFKARLGRFMEQYPDNHQFRDTRP